MEKRHYLVENNPVYIQYELHTEWSNDRFYIYHGDRVLKGLNQAKIIFKKSVILFWLLNMTIWCKHVHSLELWQFFIYFCAAHLPVRLDIETKLPISYFEDACPK